MNILSKYRAVYAPDGAQSGATGSPDNATASTPSGAPSTPTTPSSSPSPGAVGGGSPGGGTSTPSASPPASGDSASGEDYFSAIFNGGESSTPSGPAATPPAGTTGVQPPAPATPKAEPPAPPVAPTAPVAPVVAPGEKPAAVSPQPPAAATPPAPTEQKLDRYDPGALSRHLRENEAAAIEYVANNVFKLTPEEAEGLETDVMGTVPKLLARAFVMSQQNVLTQLASIVPTMIQRQNEAMKRHGENEGKFYAAWPSIKQSEHGALVTRYAAVYRQMHPEASLEQMIQDVGPMVMMAARIPATPPTTQAGLTPASPTPAGAIVNGANGRPPQPSPFVPGSAGGPVSSGTVVEPEPWEALFQH